MISSEKRKANKKQKKELMGAPVLYESLNLASESVTD